MHRRAESGQAMLLFAVGLATLVTLLAVVVNLGHVTAARTEMHQAAGQAAIAAATRFNECPKDAASVAGDARARAVEVAAANRVAGQPVTLDPNADVLFGFWDPVARSYERLDDTEAFKANSVEVLARRTEGSPDGPLELFMAGLIGGTETEGRSRAFGVPDGPGFMNTDLTIGLNECAVLGAFDDTTDPAPFPITLNYLAPNFGVASLAARPPDQTARTLATCPGPEKPIFPQLRADPLYSTDAECSRHIELAQFEIRFNLFCRFSADPPNWCSSFIPDQILSPTLVVNRDLLLVSNARVLPSALRLSEPSDLGNLVGEHVLPVYSSEEIGVFSDFDSTDSVPDQFLFPLRIPAIPPDGALLVTTLAQIDWPPLPMAVRYAPTVGFVRYRVNAAEPIFEVVTYEVTFELDSCENEGSCTIPDCCSLATFPFPLELVLDIEQIAGVQLDGEILRDRVAGQRRVGGVNFGISATGRRGPRLAQPRNLDDVPPAG